MLEGTLEHSNKSTSDLLEDVVERNQNDTISVDELKTSLNERGFGVLMAICALPLCIPFPAPPGYTTIFSVPLFILAVQMIVGKDYPWLPKWILKKQIKRSKLAYIVEKAFPMLRKIEKLLKPRMINGNIESWEKLIGFFHDICEFGAHNLFF